MPQISSSTPAPTMGWVTNKNIGQMAPNEALILTNWFPNANTVDLIKGYTQHATLNFDSGGSFDDGFDDGFDIAGIDGSTGPVESLMVWNGPSVSRMFAASAGNIYNVTDTGVGSGVGMGYANNRWQYVNFENAGGAYIVLVNGEDTPLNYDGTDLSDIPAITGSGLNSSSLINISVFKNRIFLVERDSLNLWYLGLGAIGGAASKFPLGEWCSKGGYLMATGTWSRDGGDGMDDLFVAVTSKGECLIYQGSDPGTADNWSLVGVFDVGEPIGRRCLMKFASDLIVITTNGFVPLSKILSLGVSAASAIAISAQISPTVNAATQRFRNNFGWEGCNYPTGNQIIFNIPTSVNNISEQYVANAQTGAWCRFTGFNAQCFAIFNEMLYFGTPDGRVMHGDNGQSFNGASIPSDLETSFNYFGNTAQIKNYQMVRPVMYASGDFSYNYIVNVDFREDTPVFGTGTIASAGSQWGSPWGSPWSNEFRLIQRWLSGGRQGRCAAFRMRTNLANFSISLSAFDWIMNTGGTI